MIGIKVELAIRINETGEYIIVPVLPSTIPYTTGESQADTVKILNLGDVDVLNGVALDTMEWSSFFPARYDPSYCSTDKLKEPLYYKRLFEAWKNHGTDLQVVCPAAGINTNMQVRTFTPELEGFEGDIRYTVGFKERKVLKPKKIAVAETNLVATTPTATAESRPPVATTAAPNTYTVKQGDTLSKIGKQFGKDWKVIYENNKGVIGSNPAHIEPGQVFNI